MNRANQRHADKRAEALALLAEGQANYLVAETLRVPAPLVERWRQERKDQQQATIQKIINLTSRLVGDPEDWPPGVLPAIRAALTALRDDRT